nr:nicotinamide-nucleotide amidohydrolase family protein [Methylobrevis pamukkalensis]
MTDLAALETRAETLLARARAGGHVVATAESCTGGLIAGTLTAIAGSSDVVDRGFVTYSNAAKTDLLGVPADLIERVGAVSEEVAIAMAEGALARSAASLAVAVTGVAGPGGGTATKPVGLVHLALAAKGRPTRHVEMHYGDRGRAGVRLATVATAFDLIEDAIGEAD